MTFKLQDLAIARNDEFASEAAVEAATTELIGLTKIMVARDGFITFYIRSPGSTDLIDGNGDAWRIASIVPADLAGLAADLAQLFTTTPRAYGVWTPALAWTGGGGSFTYANQEGLFYLDGNGVDLRANITFTPVTGGSGNLALTGLPFPARAGNYVNWIDVRSDTFNFQTPYGANGFSIRVAGGNSVGVFSFDAGTNFTRVYVKNLTSRPYGNAAAVSLGASGETAQILDFEEYVDAPPADGLAGWVSLFRRFGAITNGMTLSTSLRAGVAGWSGTAVIDAPGVASKTWFGANAETSFPDSSLFQMGKPITLELSGRILI